MAYNKPGDRLYRNSWIRQLNKRDHLFVLDLLKRYFANSNITSSENRLVRAAPKTEDQTFGLRFWKVCAWSQTKKL